MVSHHHRVCYFFFCTLSRSASVSLGCITGRYFVIFTGNSKALRYFFCCRLFVNLLSSISLSNVFFRFCVLLICLFVCSSFHSLLASLSLSHSFIIFLLYIFRVCFFHILIKQKCPIFCCCFSLSLSLSLFLSRENCFISEIGRFLPSIWPFW